MEIMIMNKWSQILRIIINAANTCVSVSLIEQNLKIENTSRFVATEIFFTADKIFLEIASNSEPTFSLGATFRAILIQGTTWYFPATFYKYFLSKKRSYLMSCIMHLCLYNISPNAWITWNLAAARPFPISAFDPILPRQQLLGNRCPLIIFQFDLI